MDAEFWTHPIVLLGVGYFLSEIKAGRLGQAQMGNVAAGYQARVEALEQWTKRHDDVREVLTQLREQMKTMFRSFEEIVDRLDEWADTPPPPPRSAKPRAKARARKRR